MMTNSELSTAIMAADDLVKKTYQGSAVYPDLCAHLRQLLAIQAARAGFVEQVSPYYVPYPMVTPQWVPAAPWNPPFVVTCGTAGQQ